MKANTICSWGSFIVFEIFDRQYVMHLVPKTAETNRECEEIADIFNDFL